MKGKVAVLGDEDFVMPFAALGLDTFPVGQTPGDLTENAHKILDSNYTLVVVAENIAGPVEHVFAEKANDPTPCLVVVPFTTESKGFAAQALAKTLKLATGVNILDNSNS